MARIVLLAAVLLAGCASEAMPPPDDGASSPAPVDGATTSIELLREGFIVYRAAGDQPPFTSEQGDSATFCFTVPEGTRALRAEFSWDVQQPMTLQLFEPEALDATASASGTQSPLQLEVKGPVAGEWFAYGGPSAAGGATAWTMRLMLDVVGEPVDIAVDESCY